MAEVEVCSVTSPRASNQWLNYVSESITVFRMLRADGGAGEEQEGVVAASLDGRGSLGVHWQGEAGGWPGI